jgi:hypothetical protein
MDKDNNAELMMRGNEGGDSSDDESPEVVSSVQMRSQREEEIRQVFAQKQKLKEELKQKRKLKSEHMKEQKKVIVCNYYS